VDRLVVYAFLLAWQGLVHQETFDHWLESGSIPGLALTVVTGLWLLRPRSLGWMVAALSLNIAYSIRNLPYFVNHLFFEDVVNLTILVVVLGVVLEQWRDGQGVDAAARDRIFDRLTPLIRVEVLLLYAFATLAKLNTAYLDPEVSCGALLADELIPTALRGSGPLVDFVRFASIGVSILAEGTIPLLLLFVRTRHWGITFALVFHLLLGLHPHQGIYSFSTLIYTHLFLFTDRRWQGGLQSMLRSVGPARFCLAAGALVLGGATVMFGGLWALGFERRFGFSLWFVWSVLAASLYWLLVARTRGPEDGPPSVAARPSPWLWILPLLVVLNGLCPYLGLKTETSFTMFSNLRTEEGRTNHLFVPTALQWGSYQRGLVQVLASDHPSLHQLRDWLLPRFELERLLFEAEGDVQATVRTPTGILVVRKRDGVLEGYDRPPRYSWAWGRVLLFRPVTPTGKMLCTH
jgi:hypothetical protein